MSVAWRGQSNPSCECTSCLLRCAFGFSLFAILCVPPDTTAHTPSDPFAQVIYHTSNWLWLLLYRYECTDVSARASFALQDQNVVPPNGSRHPPGLYAGVLAHGSFRPLGWLQHLVHQFVEQARLPAATGDARQVALFIFVWRPLITKVTCAEHDIMHDVSIVRPAFYFAHSCELPETVSDCSVPSHNLAKPCAG